MKQAIYGLLLYVFLMLPPVVTLLESIMSFHMHMQMPLLIIAGLLMTPFLQKKFPRLFEKWNQNGVPGILLFTIIMIYWMFPRTMDEALTIQAVQVFKFISLPFLAGVPLRDSWRKLGGFGKNVIYVSFSIMFGFMGILYVFSESQLCNNYLIVEQKTLGWGFIALAVCIIIYFIQLLFIDESEYE
ncbi:hypothetical protein J2Z83_001115 [Virgibacillus natechei]|uniref:Uncharacterized protein n=1 Tax=Virgibacillus natechei TaxID=1216297 RepID=A0ABS4IDJ3_9BACI|nr:hypothetical protein [Virgibacillus natechei]MBP1969012.1 hypothetical protein [Virgibacillus natechei]UZD14288.1 hypothetical protein OLD84_07205 [Virgibacillus natechei]